MWKYKKKYLLVIMVCLLVCSTLSGCGNKSLEEGLELLESGDYEASVDKFKEAAEKDKDAGEAYRGIGIAKWELGQYEAARNAFETALENKAEKTATIYNFLGNCEMQMGNAKAALNYYNIGMSLEGCSKELLQEMRFNEIAAYEQCGEWENAKAKLAEYTADYPEDTRAAKEAEFFETQ
ncbi:MAG: tetratricopeptide repeat protein [Dorea sp.]|jgi:tetratricopeptide (TPR) repeat protein|nr:tetratricopeptide repeat protein [Dorea sp.]